MSVIAPAAPAPAAQVLEQWKVRGISTVSGKTFKATVAAATEQQAKDIASFDGSIATNARKLTSVEKWMSEERYGKATTKDLAEFSRALATTARSKTNQLKSLQIAASSVKKGSSLRKVASDVERRVRDGETMVDAMGRHKKTLGGPTAATIQAGYESGNLADALDTLAESNERRARIRSQAILAGSYPIAMLGITALMLGTVIFVVLPNIIQVFDEVGAEVPVLTASIIKVADIVKVTWLYAITGMLSLFALFGGLRKWSHKFRLKAGLIALRVPVIGKILRGLNTLVICDIMGVLLSSGVTEIKSIRITADTVRNPAIKDALLKVQDALIKGISLTAAFRDQTPPLNDAFIGLAAQSLSGLDDKGGPWTTYGNALSIEVERKVKQLVESAPFAIMAVVGMVAALIFFAVQQPILSLAQDLGTPGGTGG